MMVPEEGLPSTGQNLDSTATIEPDWHDPSIVGIVVTYNTEPAEFLQLLNRFTTDVPLVVCDNSTDLVIQAKLQEHARSRNMIFLPMKGNVGIARAQNRGIECARNRKAAFVVLIDDDSHFSAIEVLQLREAYRQLCADGEKVGAISARAVSDDGRNLSNIADPGRNGFTQCPLLNSSGTLIPIRAFDDVGGMDERLYIDLVDFDWGWRALAEGYRLFIAEAVRFQHTLGEGSLEVFGLRAGIPSPVRHYYQTRNTLHLLTKTYVPLRWKLKQLANLAIKTALFPLCVAPRLERLGYISHGIADAITGTMGPKP